MWKGHGVLPSSQPWLMTYCEILMAPLLWLASECLRTCLGIGLAMKSLLGSEVKTSRGRCPSSWRGFELSGSGCDLWWGRVTILPAVCALFSGGYALDAGRALKVLNPGKSVCVPDLPPAPFDPEMPLLGNLAFNKSELKEDAEKFLHFLPFKDVLLKVGWYFSIFLISLL